MATSIEQVPLHEATAERYLNYALSVITSRALPDVRDGLKPVQRRILFTMYVDMGLTPSARYRKCAGVVGEVMAKYHPHGDTSIYDALVRMAQDFSLLSPLVDGQGNFGSLDGDPPAAMRYTECRLRPLAEELISEIRKDTVDWRPNYDGQRSEPVVLPAQFPHLLVNGSEGIAVGMATRIPPHNLGEVVDAAIALIEDRDLPVSALLAHVRGPDFPTGGHLLSSDAEIRAVYETGQGTLRIRGTYELDKDGRKRQIVVSSIPYGTNKARIVEEIGAHVREKKLPQVTDVRDESTDDVRIVLELKQDASAEQVMAYVFKHTALQTTWPVNLTALVPGPQTEDGPGVPSPARLNLREILVHWLDFRFETVRRRYLFDLAELKRRIHVLEGFEILFDALDEAIALIRRSEGKNDAAERLIERFGLTDTQADAILELRLYKLARLEIDAIRAELAECRVAASRIEHLLASDKRLWREVDKELRELRKAHAAPRRTTVGVPTVDLSYDEDVYIVKEDAFVVVTREGWVKRQSSFSDLTKVRVRDGDEVGWLVRAHTRSSLTFFTTHGSAYVLRVGDVTASTGYGAPLQTHFTFADGERVVGVLSHDSRHRPLLQESLPLASPSEDPPPPWAVAATVSGRVLRFPTRPHEDVSTRAGRRFARLADGDAVFVVWPMTAETDRVCVASRGGRASVFAASEIPVLKQAGKGVTGIKLKDGDTLVACELALGPNDGPVVVTSFGKELEIRERKFGLSRRGSRGKVVLMRGGIETWRRTADVRAGDDAPREVPARPEPRPAPPAAPVPPSVDDAAEHSSADGEE